MAMSNIGAIEVYDLNGFKLHVYYANDPLGDASFIIEGDNALVTLEHPLFKENIIEYNEYIKRLDKPIAVMIADYHTAGYADRQDCEVVMVEDMAEFEHGDVYAKLMKRFRHSFGDKIDLRPHGHVETVAIGTTEHWIGLDFKFVKGVCTDFPAAGIIIGNQVYYTHWAPIMAHASHLQINSMKALDCAVMEYEKEFNSGCSLFIGGHGGVAAALDLEFKIAYLKGLKVIFEMNKNPETFILKLRNTYPELSGDIISLADTLYGKQ